MPARTMACAVWHGTDDIRIERRPVSLPRGDEVLVRIAACGICATDLHLIGGAYGAHQPPKVLGHEIAGVVESVGPNVTHVQPGDAVAVDPNLPCRACYFCRVGRPFLCTSRLTLFGGFAEFVTLPEWQLYRLPSGVPLLAGTLAEPLSCCLHGLELAGLHPGGSAAVIGAGPMGLLLLQSLRLQGAAVRLVSEIDAHRRGLARSLGATHVVDPRAESVREAALLATDGRGVDCVFEFTGIPAVAGQALGLLRRGGTLVQLGLAEQGTHMSLDLQQLVLDELTVRGAFVRGQDDFRRAVQMLPQIAAEPFLTQQIPLVQYDRALAVARGRTALKVLVIPTAPANDL